jgi:anti-sigma regulatory factor (Ser/Thr protein kinase)
MPDESEKRPSPAPMRVLVCGRDDRIAERVARVLDPQLTRVFSAEELLAETARQLPDLVLTDRELSGRENLCLLTALQERVAPQTLKVILLAGESTRDDVIAAIRAKAFCFFSRPYFESAFDEILRHAAATPQWEDSIQVSSATAVWLRIAARCEVATADRLIQFMNEISDLDGKERESMGFAFKEILVNAMEYGGKFNRERIVDASYVRGSRMMLYRIRDPGDGFSFEELMHAAVSNPPEDPVRHLEVRESMGIRPGGYGVLLTQKLVDDLIYNEQGNDVLLIKYLDRRPDQQVEENSA